MRGGKGRDAAIPVHHRGFLIDFDRMAPRNNSQSSLAELRSLSAFDKDEQAKIKEEVDELVFELYGLTKEEKEIVRKASS